MTKKICEKGNTKIMKDLETGSTRNLEYMRTKLKHNRVNTDNKKKKRKIHELKIIN